MAQIRGAGVPSSIIAKVVVEAIAQKWTPLETDFERQYLNDEIDAKRLAEKHDERARDEDYRRILGEQSFDAWQKAGDDRYRLLRNNAQSWGLAPKQIDHVYATIRAYDLAVATLEHPSQVREQTGEQVDWKTVEDNLADYTRQTATDLRAYLGEERFTAMARQQVFGLRDTARPPLGSAK